MISASKEKLNIPQDDRFIGFFGDNLVNTVEFEIAEKIDKDARVELFVGFNNGTYNVVMLEKSNTDNCYIWNVKSEELFTSGLAYLQLRVSELSGKVWHSPKATVIIHSSIEEGEVGEVSVSIFKQLDNKLDDLFNYLEYYVNATCQEFVTEAEVMELIKDFITEPMAEKLISDGINQLLQPLSARLDGEKMP